MKITLYLSPTVAERIKSGALADNVSQSAYVNKLLDSAFNGRDSGMMKPLQT
jgi:hypothetical protein